MLLGFVYYSFV